MNAPLVDFLRRFRELERENAAHPHAPRDLDADGEAEACSSPARKVELSHCAGDRTLER